MSLHVKEKVQTVVFDVCIPIEVRCVHFTLCLGKKGDLTATKMLPPLSAFPPTLWCRDVVDNSILWFSKMATAM
jgi:hypothetical protein